MSTQVVPSLESHFVERISAELRCQPEQVRSADALLADGATVPFIARYRKEATSGLLDEQLEEIAKQREYFIELAERRDAILQSISEQDKLTPELEAAVSKAMTKRELEDLYLPYKPKRRTRAQIAREKGLEPLADLFLEKASTQDATEELAATFVDSEKQVPDVETALTGAGDILAERVSDSATNRARVRETMSAEAVLRVQVVPGKEEQGSVYRDYFDYREPLSKIASHRLLAIQRGEREGFLVTTLEVDDGREIGQLAAAWGCPLDTPCGKRVAAATEDGYKRLLRPSIENEVRGEFRETAENEAITVFRANLEALLMQSPLGKVAVMGLDPAYRTGCKLAVVDPTGRVVDTGVIQPIPPKAREEEAAATILGLVKKHGVRSIAVGNGTGGRETELFTRKKIKEAQAADPSDENFKSIIVAIVPETGASVYSASELARKELPDLDVSLRGAVSIARRLQDPLAELVKISPKSMGVGQYQHDVNQKALMRELDSSVERVVNRVGVELNTASPSLLRRVSGLSDRTAQAMIQHRDANGAFKSRSELLKVAGFGPKTFEQAAGFLRIRDSEYPLDSTAVHPERYGLVETMAKQLGVELKVLTGNPAFVAKVDFDSFKNAEEGIGSFTLEDIRQELERPARDPRPEFQIPEWRDDVQSIDDLEKDMVVEGRISNVTNFGAFVDIGVKRDGLVHVSELTHVWVADPREVVKVGQIVKAKVMEVDKERGRIGLSIKALEEPPETSRPPAKRGRQRSTTAKPRTGDGNQPQGQNQPQRGGQTQKPQSTSRSGKAGSGKASSGKASSGKAKKKKPEKRPAEPQTTIEDLLAKWGRKH